MPFPNWTKTEQREFRSDTIACLRRALKAVDAARVGITMSGFDVIFVQSFKMLDHDLKILLQAARMQRKLRS